MQYFAIWDLGHNICQNFTKKVRNFGECGRSAEALWKRFVWNCAFISR
jgi:hypothetical protein